MAKDTIVIQRDLGYDFIRFIATFMILVHHYVASLGELNIYIPKILKLLTNSGQVIHSGGCGVALFFMLSGALLYRRYAESFNMKLFYSKRSFRILIPLQIGFIFAFLATYIVFDGITNANKVGLLISFLGLNYCDIPWIYYGIQPLFLIGEWFTTVIILVYALFPCLRWLFVNYCKISTLFISVIFIMNIKFKILSGGNGWLSITNGFMCFWCGMLFEKYKTKLNAKIILGSTFILLLMYILSPSSIAGEEYPVCFIFSILLFIVLYQVKVTGTFIKYICRYSYEIYLVHHRIFILFLPRFVSTYSNEYQLFYATIFIVGLVFLCSEALNRAANYTIDKLHNVNFSQTLKTIYNQVFGRI